MTKGGIAFAVAITFFIHSLPGVYARDFSVLDLPAPGSMVLPSASFQPIGLKGLVVHPQDPLRLQFIVDTAQGPRGMQDVRSEASRLIQYFLTGLTVPEGDMWVNLSPYERDRIAPEGLGQTYLGRDLLAQDYVLKQLTASLIYPEEDLGREFWSKVYSKVRAMSGSVDVPVNTYNKVWIVPDAARVFEKGTAVYVTKATLKVMLDVDYQALRKNVQTEAAGPSSQIVRRVILPEIEKEVNSGSNFAPVRQMYQALILAKWYKETVHNALLQAAYIDKSRIGGIQAKDRGAKAAIYARYLEAYKKGVFNYVRNDGNAEKPVPRRYFSGGMRLAIRHVGRDTVMRDSRGEGALFVLDTHLSVVPRADSGGGDLAQLSDPFDLRDDAVQDALQAEANALISRSTTREAAIGIVMAAYARRQVLPVHFNKFPDSREQQYYLLARRFALMERRKGFDYPAMPHIHLLAAVIYALGHDYKGDWSGDPAVLLRTMFARKNITSILEVGTAGNNALARMLNDVIRPDGGSVTIADLVDIDTDGQAGKEGIGVIRGDIRKARTFAGKTFDLILSAGVFSYGGIHTANKPAEKYRIAMDMLYGILPVLSGNPNGRIIANGLRTHLMWVKDVVALVAHVDVWDNGLADVPFGRFYAEYQQLTGAGYLNDWGANLAVLRKKPMALAILAHNRGVRYYPAFSDDFYHAPQIDQREGRIFLDRRYAGTEGRGRRIIYYNGARGDAAERVFRQLTQNSMDSAMIGVSDGAAPFVSIPQFSPSRDVGGIDLDHIGIIRERKAIVVRFDPAWLQRQMPRGFDGFAPVITHVRPLHSSLPLTESGPRRVEIKNIPHPRLADKV